MKIITNPDKEYVDEIRNRLKANAGHCPCNLVKNEDTKCICKEFREQNTPGWCHCGLYKKIECEDDGACEPKTFYEFRTEIDKEERKLKEHWNWK